MKRKIVFWVGSVLIIFSFLTVLVSCHKIVEDTLQQRCENLLDTATDVSNTFVNNPTEATCEDYKDALQDYIDGCRSYTYYNQALEASLASIDCSVYGK